MTDEKLKQALAKMLPEQVRINYRSEFVWHCKAQAPCVLDTELLHLCAMVEASLKDGEHFEFRAELRKTCDKSPLGPNRAFVSATWQQRATALAKVKGIEV